MSNWVVPAGDESTFGELKCEDVYSHHVIGKKNYPWKNKKFPPAN